jgi:hypothetical protein
VIRLLFAILLAGSGSASTPAPFLDTGFGPETGGLQLGLTVDATGKTATFQVKNTGPKPVTFVEAYSCSGQSPWGISMGATDARFDHYYNFEPTAHGLSTKAVTVCTRNVPTRRRTVAAGTTAEIVIPFASAGEIVKSSDRAFRATAALDLDGRTGPLVLTGATQTR